MALSHASQIPYGRQVVDEDDVRTVVEALRSDFLTQGPTVERFETALATSVGAAHAVAVSSGTAGLHIAAIAAGLGPGRTLWTVPNTFVASANCARYCGADVDFVDIDPVDGNMSMAALSEKLRAADRAGRLPDVVVPVYFAGHPPAVNILDELRRRYGFTVIEDASHAVGARDAAGHTVGSCAAADMSVFSFHPVKIVTTAEGGAVTTQRADLAERLRRLRSHGITRDPRFMASAPAGGWDYHQIELGYNYRLSDLHAALGLSQIAKLDRYVAARNALAARYDAALEGLPLRPLKPRSGARSSYHLYVVRVSADAPRSRKALFDALHDRGIRVQVHYIPVHLQPYYRALGFKPGDFPEAEGHYAEAVSLPIYPSLTSADQDRVCESIVELSARSG
jgi:UDP-4-amino-4,6-dideoxy-N-acetyl-beta-L-altrosamine transaminase